MESFGLRQNGTNHLFKLNGGENSREPIYLDMPETGLEVLNQSGDSIEVALAKQLINP